MDTEQPLKQNEELRRSLDGLNAFIAGSLGIHDKTLVRALESPVVLVYADPHKDTGFAMFMRCMACQRPRYYHRESLSEVAQCIEQNAMVNLCTYCRAAKEMKNGYAQQERDSGR